jgi:hypothetical protein
LEKEATLYTYRFVGLSLFLMLLGSSRSLGAEQSTVSALKEKGITKSGVTLVIEAEKPVLTKVKEVRELLTNTIAATTRKAEAEQAITELARLKESRADLQEKLNELNQLINEQGFQQANNAPRPGNGPPGQGNNTFAQAGYLQQLIAQRNMLKSNLVEITSAQNAINAHLPATDTKAMDGEVKANLEASKATVAEMRPMIDEVLKRYTDLASDPSVKAAIGELERATKAKFKLGPSDGFKAAVKMLDEAERKLLGKKPLAASNSKKKKSKSRK